MKRVARIASLVEVLASGRPISQEWRDSYKQSLLDIEKEGPSGSGLDVGTMIIFGDSRAEKLVLSTSFHHMYDNGMYAGWTEHQIIVTASLMRGFKLRITGRDRNNIKVYLADVYSHWLNEEVGNG